MIRATCNRDNFEYEDYKVLLTKHAITRCFLARSHALLPRTLSCLFIVPLAHIPMPRLLLLFFDKHTHSLLSRLSQSHRA
jgi:hypothetical protein